MVVSLPLGTFFISESTSVGAGMTNRPSPNFLENLPSPLSPYLGKSLESLSLAVQLTLTRFIAMTGKAWPKGTEMQFTPPEKALASRRFLADFSRR